MEDQDERGFVYCKLLRNSALLLFALLTLVALYVFQLLLLCKLGEAIVEVDRRAPPITSQVDCFLSGTENAIL